MHSAAIVPAFNPRVREGGDSVSPRSCVLIFTFQSTPPRGRRLDLEYDPDIDDYVSIHASAREATGDQAVLGVIVQVSIHASAREATRRLGRCRGSACFNPRLREGGDRSRAWHAAQIRVSIHASAREATHFVSSRSRISEFQSTPPRGRRRK